MGVGGKGKCEGEGEGAGGGLFQEEKAQIIEARS